MHPCGKGTEANPDIGAGGRGCQALIGALPGAPRAPKKRLVRFGRNTDWRVG